MNDITQHPSYKAGAIGVLAAVLVVVGLICLWAAAFVVSEGEQAVVTRFGKVVRVVKEEAGLYFKAPFVETVHKFQKRLLEFDGDPKQTQTNDKKPISIDTFARWRIVDPQKFFETVRDEPGARSRLTASINSATVGAMARHRLVEAVRNTNRHLTQDKEVVAARAQMEEVDPGLATGDPDKDSAEVDDLTIEVGREKIAKEITDFASREVAEIGVELIDVKIKRINYGDDGVKKAVFDRMKSAREQIAQKYRSEGREQRSVWMGQIDQDRSKILSGAFRTAETRRGEADAEAARIYSDAYGKDPEFYAFWKTLQLYRETLGSNSTLVVSTNSDLFRYLQQGGVLNGTATAAGGD